MVHLLWEQLAVIGKHAIRCRIRDVLSGAKHLADVTTGCLRTGVVTA
jgi:hypothetical protein